jgi:hypothetical protein
MVRSLLATGSAIPDLVRRRRSLRTSSAITRAEMEPLSDLLAAVAAEADWLANGDDARFTSEVALRLQQE